MHSYKNCCYGKAVKFHIPSFCFCSFFVLFFVFPMRPHVLVDFVVLPPGHGRNVTYFWGWDAHEAHLRCPDDVSGDIGGCSAMRALKPKFYQPTQTMVTAGILPFRENSHGSAGNRTRDLMIWSLSYPACNAHAPYCYLWPAPLYNNFPHYLIKARISGKKLIEHKMCFDFLFNFCQKHFSF